MKAPGFTFGRNWQRYLDEMPPEAVESMRRYVAVWLGDDLAGKTVLDIGSGQGLSSLAAHTLGARVTSMDLDPDSVAATTRLWRDAGSPNTWTIRQGDVLDDAFMATLGHFDVVLSWGVLHHTGHLWRALALAAALVADEGVLWIALYHRTVKSQQSVRTKRLYRRLPNLGKAVMRSAYVTAKLAKSLIANRRLPQLRGSYDQRGMSWWRDVEDWLGGYPYEVSSPGEVVAELRPIGFELVRLEDGVGEASNDIYKFQKRARTGGRAATGT